MPACPITMAWLMLLAARPGRELTVSRVLASWLCQLSGPADAQAIQDSAELANMLPSYQVHQQLAQLAQSQLCIVQHCRMLRCSRALRATLHTRSHLHDPIQNIAFAHKGGIAGLLTDGAAKEVLSDVPNEKIVGHLLVGTVPLY